MFNIIKRCVTAKGNHAWINVLLPAVESENKDGNYCEVVDPKLSSQDILDELKKYWTEEYLCRNMLTRFVSVLCDNKLRTELEKFCVENPSASQDAIEEFMQNYADSGWNVALMHPKTVKQAKSQEKKQSEAGSLLEGAETEVQLRVAEKMMSANPALKKALAKLMK